MINITSEVDSFLFISGCTIGKDIIPYFTQPTKSNIITNTRAGIIISALLSAILATFFQNAIDMWYVFGSFAVSTVLVPLIASFYNIKVKFPVITIIAPFTITLFWFYTMPLDLDPMYPGLASSIICFYIFMARD